MPLTLARVQRGTVSGSAPPTGNVVCEKEKPGDIKTKNTSQFFTWENWDKYKPILNYAANGSAAAFAIFTFLSANLNFFRDSVQEKLDFVSEKLERLGNGLSGMIGAIDLGKKKNTFPCIGYASMVPISAFISGFNNWLARGVSIGLNAYAFITESREVVDKNGEPTKDKEGKIKLIGGDFSEILGMEGFIESTKVGFVESVKMFKELIKKPERIKKFTHATLITSTLQILGPIIAVSGLWGIGSFIRNVAGIAGYGALLLHKRKEGCPFFGINFSSSVVQCSLLRICTSFVDQLKRFDYFSSRIKNLTDLSLAFDRLAGLKFTQGIFGIQKNGK